MRLVKIEGNIWLLTRQWDGPFGEPFDTNGIDQNERAIRGLDIGWRGGGRLLAKNGVRSLAHAIIEIQSPLPQQNEYTIYHCSKGFYCNVQGVKVYLIDLLEKETKNDQR